jgi:ABC-2 type transport system ATP-binding protein
VIVRSPQATELRDALSGDGIVITSIERDRLEVHGLSAAEIGAAALKGGIELHELTPKQASLEDAFMRLTGDSVEYHASAELAPGHLEEAA